jgi:hypothetical protein
MEFKRLNSMTGKDPILNRRIASIFLNDFENFLVSFSELPTLAETENIKFIIHRNSPSFIIFELEALLAKYNYFLDKKQKGENIEQNDQEFLQLLNDTKLKIEEVRQFIGQLNN